MPRRPKPQPVAERFRERIYLGGPGKPPILSTYWTRSKTGEVLNYGLAYIDFSLNPRDNGRVLGYDNGHQVHERHFMGRTKPLNFISYEETSRRFFAEVRKIRKETARG